MRVIKYFFEEPTHLEASSDVSESSGYAVKGRKRHFRGHLAASDLDADIVGGSALEDQAAARILARVLQGPIWFSNRAPGQVDVSLSLLTGMEDIVQALSTMGGQSVMMTDVDPTKEIIEGLSGREDGLPGLHMVAQLLDAGCTLIFPESAQMGHDWSVFSPRPFAADFRDAMRTLPDDIRAFVIPYTEVRGERGFYFEQENIGRFSQYEVS